MDAVTEALYTEHIKDREPRISPESASNSVARETLGCARPQADRRRHRKSRTAASPDVGVGSGMIGGMLARSNRRIGALATLRATCL